MMHTRIAWILFGLSLCLVSGYSLASAEEVAETFLPSGVTKRLGGYRPIRAEMNDDASIVSAVPKDLQSPKFGYVKVGDQKWAFVLDEPEDAPAKLWIDTNGDGDLTNDPATTWKSTDRDGLLFYDGTGEIDLGKGSIGTLGIYRFDPNDEKRESLKNVLLYYLDFGWDYTLTLDGTDFTTFVAGGLAGATTLSLDRNGDGKISRKFEMITLGKPFNFTGTTYVLSTNGGKLMLDVNEKKVEQLPLPPNLNVGESALPFTATTLAGDKIDFPSACAGKIVMLDFWATWCGPCIGEIPNMKRAYADWHHSGFEIIGISLDGKGDEKKVRKFLADKELPWDQVFEGGGWDISLATMHDVSAIPFVLLVDGDSGNILASAGELRGPTLTKTIGRFLREKRGGVTPTTDEEWAEQESEWLADSDGSLQSFMQALNYFAGQQRWKNAAAFASRAWEKSNPDPNIGLFAAPILVLAGDVAAYRKLCDELIVKSKDVTDARTATYVCKACALMPDAVDGSKLPTAVFVDELEKGETPRDYAAFRWALRALLAYRDGDTENAFASIEKAKEFPMTALAAAQDSAIRALIEKRLGHAEAALDAENKAVKQIEALEQDETNKTNRDLWIAKVLLREVQGSSLPNGAETTSTTDE